MSDSETELGAIGTSDRGRARLVIVTGISGAAVGHSIDAARRQLGADLTLHVRLDEDYLVRGAFIATSGRLERDRPDLTFADLMHLYPDSVLLAAWPEALRLALVEVDQGIADGKTVFLQIHMTYLHNESKSILSAIDAQILRHLLTPYLEGASVVCIIDDVYDTYTRLSRQAMIFSFQNRRLTWKSQNVREILAWRATEIRITQLIASGLGLASQFTLLAAKHPTPTFVKALDPRVRRIYLSHPITPFRRARLESDFSKEGINFIEEFARELRRAEDFVVFEPTTIDELRFIGEAPLGYPPSSFQVTSIELDRRWPKQYGSEEPPLSSADNSFTAEDLERIERSFFQLDEMERDPELFIQDKPEHLDSLVEEIRRQISSCDRLLINQSDAVIALVPFIGGAASDGMTIEIDYRQDNNELLPHGVGPAVLVHASHHEQLRIRAGIERFLRAVVGIADNYEALSESANRTALEFMDPANKNMSNLELGRRLLKRIFDAGYPHSLRNMGAVVAGGSPLASDNPGAGQQDVSATQLAELIRLIINGDTKGRHPLLNAYDRANRYSADRGWGLYMIENFQSPQHDAQEVLKLLRDGLSND